MLHEGEFDSLIVEQPHGLKTIDGPLPFDLDGFAFTVYLPVQHRIIVDVEQDIHGYVDDSEVAHGTVDLASIRRRDGEDILCVSASPDNHEVTTDTRELVD